MSEEAVFLQISQELFKVPNLDRDIPNIYYHTLEMKFGVPTIAANCIGVKDGYYCPPQPYRRVIDIIGFIKSNWNN